MEDIIESDIFKEALSDSINGLQNENILQLSSDKIYQYKQNILHELNLDDAKRDKMEESLKEYRYIDDINDFTLGEYIRWINIAKDEELTLSRGAFITDIAIHNEDVCIKCKICCKYPNNRTIHLQILGGENIIFQKLSTQEKIILSALDYINKK